MPPPFWIKNLQKSRILKFGIPFFALILGGSFGLEHFTKIRYEYRRAQLLPKELEKSGLTMKKPTEVTLENEYEKMRKTVDIDNWENKRGPRPWEENF